MSDEVSDNSTKAFKDICQYQHSLSSQVSSPKTAEVQERVETRGILRHVRTEWPLTSTSAKYARIDYGDDRVIAAVDRIEEPVMAASDAEECHIYLLPSCTPGIYRFLLVTLT